MDQLSAATLHVSLPLRSVLSCFSSVVLAFKPLCRATATVGAPKQLISEVYAAADSGEGRLKRVLPVLRRPFDDCRSAHVL